MGLAVVFQSTDLSLVNLVGLAICLLGICVHVIKKALEAENPSKSIKYSRYEPTDMTGYARDLELVCLR